MSPDRFCLLPHASLAGLFVGAAPLHFSEYPLSLHFLFKDFEGLIDIVVADGDLQLTPSGRGAVRNRSIKPCLRESASPAHAVILSIALPTTDARSPGARPEQAEPERALEFSEHVGAGWFPAHDVILFP